MPPIQTQIPSDIDFSASFWQDKTMLIDSRNLLFPEKSIFWALKGRFKDGHEFIGALYKQGVRHFVISKSINRHQFPDAQFVKVESVVATLQAFAKVHRQQFKLPVIAITGSNGKTILKEWLYLLLQQDFALIKSPKSYNSQIGVPLSVLNINAKHNLGIFETGISQRGEMQALANIIQPDIGIITNIGKAHESGFASSIEKIREKLSLFKASKIIIYRYDHIAIRQQIKAMQLKNCFAWGTSLEADMPVHFQKKKKHTLLNIHYKNKLFKVKIPFKNAAALENCAHAICTLLFLGIKPKRIEKYIHFLRDVPMRLELKEGINNCKIIDDSYNNDIQGLQIALDFLESKQLPFSQKVVVLSDLPEAKHEQSYLEVARFINEHQIHRLIGIGTQLNTFKHLFRAVPMASFYDTTEQFIDQIGSKEQFKQSTILLKGARSFRFERIAHHLKKRIHGSVLEINMGAIINNLKVYRNCLRKHTKIMVMVKAAAYGSGSTEVAQLLQYNHVDYLGVAYVDEGVKLRQQGIKLPIMVMNTAVHEYDILMQNQLEPAIFSPEMLEAWLKYIDNKILAAPYPIHLEIDSGMHRLGFQHHELDLLIKQLKKHQKKLAIKGIFSHLAVSDNNQMRAFSLQQAALFKECALAIEAALSIKCIKHLLNSAAIHSMADYQFDMVRLGIGLYGYDAHRSLEKLDNVLTFKTSISQIKQLNKGDYIGYGGHTKVDKATTIAILAIGYADGFMRIFGNGNATLSIRGKQAKTIGNVCMDMCFVDITGIAAETGDEVIIFEHMQQVEQLAAAAKSIPYEILTNISERVPRIFFED